MQQGSARTLWIGVLVAGGLLAAGYLMPSARLATGEGWSAEPSSVPAFAGSYLLGAVAVFAALAVMLAKGRLLAVVLWGAIALSTIAVLSVSVFETLLLLDCLENKGRSPDLVGATTIRVSAALAVAWPAFLFMLGLLLSGGVVRALYARVLTLSGIVLITWFACLGMAGQVGYGVWVSLSASAVLAALGGLVWEQEPLRRA